MKIKYKMIAIVLIILAIIAWRKSYFLFTPKLMDKFEKIKYTNLNIIIQEKLKTNWEIKEEYEESLTPEERLEIVNAEIAAAGIHHKPDSAWINRIREPFVAIPFLETEEKRGFYKRDFSFTYLSPDYNWKRTFRNYYTDGGPIAFNQNYVIYFFRRGPHFRLFKTVSGAMVPIRDSSSPPIYIYLLFNTAKIGWNEVYIVDRKTGKIKEKYRINDDYDIKKADLLPDNKLYIRTGNQVYIHQLP